MEPAQIADHAQRAQAVRGALNAVTRDWPSERLFANAEALGDLLDHPGWAVLEQLMEARKSRLVTSLVHGAVLEQHGYVAQTSMLSGIDQVLYAGHVVKQLATEKQRELEQQAHAAGEEQ
jgi:hypothetical protein